MLRAVLRRARRVQPSRAAGRRAVSSAPAVAPPSAPVAPHGHRSVMLDEVVRFMAGDEPEAERLVVDGTVGAGGHAHGILEAAPGVRLVGVDRDGEAVGRAASRLAPFGERVTLSEAPFSAVDRVLEACGETGFDGLLLDLGVSSMQLDQAARGFSFRRPGPLDMRMSAGAGETAAELVARLPAPDLEGILRAFGEERYAGLVADELKRRSAAGTLRTTGDLEDACRSVYSRFGGGGGNISPATRTCQALRIAVNDELGELQRVLQRLEPLARPGARVAIISFHSLEDRIVKRRVADLKRRGLLEPGLGRRPVLPTADERASNPRSRSAKLRVFQLAR